MSYDPRETEDVTGHGRTRAGQQVRPPAAPATRGRLPNPRLIDRSRRRRAGGMATPVADRRPADRQPRAVADHGRRADLPEHAPLAPDAWRAAAGRVPAG